MIDFNSAEPWIRNIEVVLGPLGELDQSSGPPSPFNSKRIFSDGSPTGLRVNFSVKKHIVSTSCPTSINLYNLSENTRQSIKSNLTYVALNVGYANITGMRNIFSGSVLSCFSNREGSDIVTSLSCLQHYGGLTQMCKVEMFPDTSGWAKSGQITVGDHKITLQIAPDKGTSLWAVVKSMASSIPGVICNDTLIKVPDKYFTGKGFKFQGLICDCLNKLARGYGFSWFIDNGIFYALTDGESFDAKPVIISADNGYLIRAEPMFYGPAQGQVGVSITSVLNPLIDVKPGARVQLKSSINPRLNNANNLNNVDDTRGLGYIVTDLTHSGDSHSSQWQSHMECRFMGVRK